MYVRLVRDFSLLVEEKRTNRERTETKKLYFSDTTEKALAITEIRGNNLIDSRLTIICTFARVSSRSHTRSIGEGGHGESDDEIITKGIPECTLPKALLHDV